jgi:hypothetical protein
MVGRASACQASACRASGSEHAHFSRELADELADELG